MAGEPWREQVAYYRHRAVEYDMTSYGDLPGTERRITALVDGCLFMVSSCGNARICRSSGAGSAGVG